MLGFEQKVWAAGAARLAGLDEAGRGPLAGPVVAAAVFLPRDFVEAEALASLADINDSKQLPAPRREACYDLLMGLPGLCCGVGIATVEEIDRINILRATHLAMGRALAALDPPADHVLVDGLPVPGLPCPSTPVVGGDGLSLLIAAASIIAKVRRDRLMAELDEVHPGYGFVRHKGYGTPEHLQALDRLGPCDCHRRSFAPVAQLRLHLGA